jgi:hypothetical protein
MALFDLTFERKWAFSGPFSKKKHLRGIFNFLSTSKLFVGNIKVLGGPHVARRLDVAQGCHTLCYDSSIKK